jgi:predicted type IV restriction endonuclease
MAAETVAQAISGIRKEFPNMDGLGSEVDVKSFVIERILLALDWNQTLPREVKKEYPVGKDKVDYALNPDSPTMVFVEAKKPGVNFDKPVQQLLKYCFQEAVNLAVLTDGRIWWLYLPEHKGPQGESLHWSKKRFYEIDIINGGPAAIQNEFEKFLSKEKVSSGEAVEAARSEIDERDAIAVAHKDMVDTWNDFVTKPSDELIKLLTGSIASLKDVKPNKRQRLVKEFFQNHRAQFKVSDVSHSRPKPATNGVGGGQSGKPSSFIFFDVKHPVGTWKRILPELCKLIYDRHQDTFYQKIINIQGRKNLYFSSNLHELRNPEPIGDSNMFAATAPNASEAQKRCHSVLRAFGYAEDCFRIE